MRKYCDKVYYNVNSGKFLTNVEAVRDIDADHLEVSFSGGEKYRYLSSSLQSYDYSHSEKSDDQVNLKLMGRDSSEIYFPKEVRIYGNNEVYGAIDKLGKEYLYYGDKVILRKYYSTEHSDMEVFSYLKELSALKNMHNYEEDADDKKGTPSIKPYYEKLKAFSDDSLLNIYCQPDSYKAGKAAIDGFLIFPFGCNESQCVAVQNALENRLSIIQGPPGTGKTQTILNVIANLLIRNKTCMIASCSNSAVRNVVEKFVKYNMDFLVATLGSKENRKEFCKQQSGMVADLSTWMIPGSEINGLRQRIEKTSSMLGEYFRSLSRESLLKCRVEELKHQMDIGGDSGVVIRKRWHLPLSLSAQYRILARYESDMENMGKMSWLTTLGTLAAGLDTSDPETMLAQIQRRELRQIENELADIKEWIARYEIIYKGFQDDCMAYLKHRLACDFSQRNRQKWGYVEEEGKYGPSCRFSFSQTPEASREFLKECPIVTSSTFSVSACLHNDVAFDYLIMDEASQVSLTEGALAVNYAHNAIIVGDEKQLPNVVARDEKKIADEIFKKSDLGSAYDYVNRSFLTSLLQLFPKEAVPRTLLKEHYRCHPKIIGFCNSQFYDGMLEIMTPYETETNPLEVRLMPPGKHAEGNRNVWEAYEIVGMIEELISHGYTDIGVVVPYNAQVDCVRSLMDKPELKALKDRVLTTHKFQGRENDVIIMSVVADDANKFIDDPNLVNVAVSRAKRKFILIRTDNEIKDGNIQALTEYIKYQKGDVSYSGLRSVFDVLFRQYSDEKLKLVQSSNRISEYTSENQMYDILKDMTDSREGSHLGIMFEYPLRKLITTSEGLSGEEVTYANRSWTHVDFLLYNKTTKKPVLVIEVDGYHYHNSQERMEKDAWKNHILDVNKIPYLRFSTRGCNEREIIIEKLKEVDNVFCKKSTETQY